MFWGRESTMTATEYFELSLRLGNAIKVADALGISVRQHYYYVDGHTPVPLTIERLLRLLAAKRTRRKIARDALAAAIIGVLIGAYAGATSQPQPRHWNYGNCNVVVTQCAIG